MKYIALIFILTLNVPILVCGQIPYGNNPDVGKYVQSDDAKIYYEVYGEGEPILLIHGSLYGYISEYEHILPTLTENYKVIAVALRGHGKSEIGNKNYSYALFAKDMVAVLDAEKIDKAMIIGFSSGAITAIKIAADYPQRVIKVVSIAGALSAKDKSPERRKQQKELSADKFVAENKAFVENRKKLMSEPDRFMDFYQKLMNVDNDSVWISKKDASHILSPVLVIGGDRDIYFPIDAFQKMYSIIPNSRLLIIPNSGTC